MRFAETVGGRPFTKDPAVVRLNGRRFMYYSLPPEREGGPWRIGIACEDGAGSFVPAGRLEPEQDCERNGLCAPGAIVLDGCVHMFYQTYGNGARDAICHAVSRDGLYFERDGSNPVFSPTGAWTCGRAIDADVVEFRGELIMYFATRDPGMRVQMLGAASAPLGSGYGRGDWTQRCDESILRPELDWEQDCIEAPAACVYGGRVYLFYGGAYNNAPQQIGCAVSDDGFAFRRISDVPFLPNGAPGSWNASESGHPFAFEDGGRYFLYYQGNCDGGRTWYISRAEFEFRGGMPVLTVGSEN
ncbi:MAG: hypothetical protein ACI4L8_08250 [Candidatus Fimadaptatus sp.]